MNAAVADAGRPCEVSLCQGGILAVSGFAIFAWARYTSLVLHEAAHAVIARALGFSPSISCERVFGGSESSFTDVPGIAGTTSSHVVRHAGWIFSFVIALAVSYLYCTLTWCQDSALVSSGLSMLSWWPVPVASWWTALDAIASDLLQHGESTASADRFWCGNFGLLLLDMKAGRKARALLETAIRVTMMRGAQSAGLVTYTEKEVGVRRRVVNGKRTDLCTLLMRQYAPLLKPANLKPPQMYAPTHSARNRTPIRVKRRPQYSSMYVTRSFPPSRHLTPIPRISLTPCAASKATRALRPPPSPRFPGATRINGRLRGRSRSGASRMAPGCARGVMWRRTSPTTVISTSSASTRSHIRSRRFSSS